MDPPEVRQLSLSLFTEIKPACVKLSLLAQLPLHSNSAELIQTLRDLTELLQSNHDNNSADQYLLSTKLADYVFFPISNLLKFPSLDDQVVRYILNIIQFLLLYSWKNNIDEKFLDQLSPLIVFLCGGPSISSSKSSNVKDKDLLFKQSAVSCLSQTIKCFPRLYFTKDETVGRRLSVLGDCTTILLDVMSTLGSPLNQDENRTVLEILETIEWLYSTRVTSEQTSFVFPGMVSKIVNFTVSTKNIHVTVIVKVLKTLQTLIIKVFSDKDLKINISDGSVTLDNLLSLQDLTEEERQSEQKLVPIDILFKDTKQEHRTQLWLRATSKQLKLSLLSLFKFLLFNSSTRTKVAVNIQVSDAIFAFVKAINEKCFQSLFNEVVQTNFDVLSALIFVIVSHSPHILEMDLLNRANKSFIHSEYDKLELLRKQLDIKITYLLSNQFPSVLSLLNEEKICVCITAIKVHLHILQTLVELTQSGSGSLKQHQQKALQILVSQISAQEVTGKSQFKSNKGELSLSLGGNSQDKGNKLDEIELPPHINASSLTNLRNEEKTLNPVQGSSNLRMLISDWSEEYQDQEITIFRNVFTKATEKAFKGLIEFIGHQSQENMESMVSMICETTAQSGDGDQAILDSSVSLWAINQLIRASSIKNSSTQDFKVDDFLALDDEDSSEPASEEIAFMVLEKALETIGEAKERVLENAGTLNRKQYLIYHMAYMAALESIEILSYSLTKEDFQTDFLMDHLLLLLEALTFPNDSVAHLQARKTLNTVVHNYYNGSLGNLILDNADYLIDSLSMSLSVASGLTPSLPGILLVILKISGVQLLQTNQLHDILSEIFIVIDSYHGYSALVENFFLVFEIIVEITAEVYSDALSDEAKVDGVSQSSRYKPWGMSTRDEMLSLIDDNEKLVDGIDDFDLSKKYFKKNPGIPFGDVEADSDDEDEQMDGNEENNTSQENEWKGPVPKDVYVLIQQIFTYGLQFLSHPSDKLKGQVLKTLLKAYPLMSTNYTILMPLLAQYWPLILVLTSGVSTTSEYESNKSLQHLIEPSLQLMTEIIREDAKHELFMSRRFVDTWDFWKKKSPTFHRLQAVKPTKQLVPSARILPATSQLYVGTLLAGLDTYGKSIPDLTALEIAEACVPLGIPQDVNHQRDVEALLWVVSNAKDIIHN